MYYYWIKDLRLWNVLVAITVFCLAYTAYSQRPRTTPIEDNPIYIQNFMSKMMSKNPLADMKKPRDADGINMVANLGYEPYWEDEVDRPWEEKCMRCPELFKRYTAVCATDNTGDMIVNISMCEILRMNCLGGYARGNTTSWYAENRTNYYVVSNEWARIATNQEFDLNIMLSSHPDKAHDHYVITLDGWKGLVSGFFKNHKSLLWYHSPGYDDRALQYKPKWTEFVMRWNFSSGWFLMTRQDYTNWTQGFHFNITDPKPFPIKFISISANDGKVGHAYIVKGLMVTHTEPCADGPVARPLPTSPTSAPGIFASHSPANIGYFSRISDAGLGDGKYGNVSFHTREEY